MAAWFIGIIRQTDRKATVIALRFGLQERDDVPRFA